ncbi:MAG TPA: GAF and ANTAR domain-containing protein [Mycobacteriales bacterium]|jgi:vacuolar-type H+-ATPase catalytic subunit A/Vma1|nr:GAF and ANTAR domain-containing protein [Mycobacteriales bacterium]
MVEQDLSEALASLAGLLTGVRTLEETLTQVAQFAVRAIPGAEGAGLTLLAAGRAQTVVASHDFVRRIDEVQYGLDEGPCVSAVAERRTVSSGSLGGAAQWPRFGPRVGRLGVHSALSLPLLLPDRVVGAVNVYAHPKNVFGFDAVRLGELFAPPAAVTVFNAQVLAQSQALVAQLHQALTSRAVIDQALGIVMSRTGASAEEALNRLRAISQSESIKLADVAAQILAEAVRRARQRRQAMPADPAASSSTPRPAGNRESR